MRYTRRRLLAGIGLAGLGAAMSPLVKKAAASSRMNPLAVGANTCPFRLTVINDEITQDFEKVCQIVSGDFGLLWIELRSMWNKNVTELDAKQVEDARKILEEHKLRVTDIASPLFKTDWPGAPRSSQSETRDQFHADFEASAQDKLLERCISLAKSFNTARIRCFDYWRLDDQKPYRAAINAKLQQAAERCAKDNVVLLLENEMSCNTATGAEAAAVLKAIPNLGSGRRRYRGLGWATSGFAAGWLPLRAKSRNPLARRRHAGSVHTRQHGWTQEDTGQGWNFLLTRHFLVSRRQIRSSRLRQQNQP
jgi:hypothetical protein